MKGSVETWIGAGIGVFILGLLIMNFAGWTNLGVIFGFATISLDQADFVQSTTLPDSSFWNQPLWILSVSQSRLAQSAIGTIDPQEIGSLSGRLPEKYFSIDMTFDKQTCNYPLAKEYGSIPPLSDFTLEYWQVNQLSACDYNSHCTSPIASGESSPIIGLKECWCVDEAVISNTIDRNLAAFNTRTTGSVIVGNTDGDEQVHNFDTHDPATISAFITPDIFFYWDGYKSSDYTCPDSDEYYAYWSPQTGGWVTGVSSNYDVYAQKYNNLELNLVGKTGQANLQAVVNDINNARWNAETSVFWGYFEGSSIDNTIVVLDVIDAIKYPQYVFYIKAGWLGIDTAEPDISIVSAVQQGQCFEANGYAEITLRNSGESGNTDVSIGECTNGFDGSGPITVGLAAGETRKIIRPISASVSSQQGGTCTVISNDNFHVSRKTFSVCAIPASSCGDGWSPGDLRCWSDDSIRRCNNDGTAWELIENCALGGGNCVLENGVPTCKSGSGGQSCQIDSDCIDTDSCTTNERCEPTWWGLGPSVCTPDPVHSVECGCPPGSFFGLPIPDFLCMIQGTIQGVTNLLIQLFITIMIAVVMLLGIIILITKVVFK